MKDKTRKRLMAVLMAIVMLGGVFATRSPVEAKTWNKWQTYWRVLGKGTSREVVKKYDRTSVVTGEDFYTYYKVLSIKEAIKLGATEAYHVEETSDSLSYAAIIKARNTAGVDLQNSFYCPIKVTGRITEDGTDYVIDDAGYKLRDNTGYARGEFAKNGKIPGIQIGYRLSKYVKPTISQAAKQPVFGIKGYTKQTQKPALCAMLNDADSSGDSRYFLSTNTYRTNDEDDYYRYRNSDYVFPSLEPLEPGYTKEISVTVNNASKKQNATGVRLYFSKIPSTMKKGEILKFTAKLTGNNVIQSPIKNTIEFVATDDIRIKKVYCIGWKDTCPSSFMTRKESKTFFTKVFSKQGALIGYRGFDPVTTPNYLDFNGIIAPYGATNYTISEGWDEHITLEIEKLK